MQTLILTALDALWPSIAPGTVLPTPSKAKTFTVAEVGADRVNVVTESGLPMSIHRAAFVAALGYLVRHGHVDRADACEIRSQYDSTGPLSLAICEANGSRTVVSTYVLPILQQLGLVKIDGAIPTTTWLA